MPLDSPLLARLDQADRVSACWAHLRTHLYERLDNLRKQNDGDKDEIQTAKLRGRIAEVKALLSLEQDSPASE